MKCQIECNKVNFAVNRLDVGRDEGRNSDVYTSIYFYFTKLETTEITQSPSMTTTSLISNVGGLLGRSPYFIIFLIKKKNF